MFGIIAAVVAKARSMGIEKDIEAYSIGYNLDKLKRSPDELQSLIDSTDPATVGALYGILSDDPDAIAFKEVNWSVRKQ